MTHGLISL